MQIACPACAATYQVPDAMIGDGRQMRCVRCAECWYVAAPLARSMEPAPGLAAQLPAPAEATAVVAAQAEPAPHHGKRGLLVLAWVGSITAWAAGLYAVWAGRDIWTALWPPMARLYAMLGPA